MMIRITSLLPLLVLGCTFDEHLPQVDISGTVVIPREAATRTVTNPTTGELVEVTDTRFIGPVVLGAFASINADDFPYPHPEIGPVIGGELEGNTYPYGGGTVGRFDFACFEDLACRISTGRFRDFQDILNFFAETLDDPVVDEYGTVVDSAEYFRAYCYELFQYTADYELAFVSNADMDGDGTVADGEGLHFAENPNGDFEANFTLWQVTYKPDMQLWGWMDTPSEKYTFSTCDPDRGQRNTKYSNDYYYGSNYTDLLNYPSKYVYENDWVSSLSENEGGALSSPVVGDYEDADAFRAASPDLTIHLDHQVQ
jgi:hypothetical protein